MTHALTEDIDICVEPYYIEERIVEQQSIYVFGYKITIRNNSKHTVQLLSRHWFITDSDGNQSEVQGDGVVGIQPVIEPLSEFQYSSGSNFKTPVGTMHGTYDMICQSSLPTHFSVKIAPFLLADKTMIH